MDEAIRTKKLIRNTAWAIAGYLIYTVTGFVSRMVFIQELGIVYSGIASYFTNIIVLFTVAEMGFGTAIGLKLYKPVAEHNERKISAYINLYEQIYRVVASVLLVAGLCILPFAQYLVNEEDRVPYLTLYFALYIIKALAGYCFACKGCLIALHQDGYKTSNISNFFLILQMILQTILLYVTKSFLLYLVLQAITPLVTNIFIERKAKQLYPYLKTYKNEQLEDSEKKTIYRYVKAFAVDKTAWAIRTSTDNILVSRFISVSVTGLLDNYTMILTCISALIEFLFSNAIPAIGNMNVLVSKESRYQTLKDMQFVNAWIYGICTACLGALIQPFILLWLGSTAYWLSNAIFALLLFNFFIVGMSKTMETHFSAFGLIRKIPWVMLSMVVVNLVISLSLVGKWGVVGVYIGTVASHILTRWWIYPYMVLKHEFDGQYMPYVKKYAIFTLIAALASVSAICAASLITQISFFAFIAKGIVCVVVYHIVFLPLICRTCECRTVTKLAWQYGKTLLKQENKG